MLKVLQVVLVLRELKVFRFWMLKVLAIQGQAGNAQGLQVLVLKGTRGSQGLAIQGQAGNAQGTTGTQGLIGMVIGR